MSYRRVEPTAYSGYEYAMIKYSGIITLPTTQSRVGYHLFLCPHEMTIDSFTVRFNAAMTTGATMRFGLYHMDGAGGEPGTLLSEIGSTGVDPSGITTIGSLSIKLPGGLLALASVPQGAAGSGSAYGNTSHSQSNGVAEQKPSTRGWYENGVAGALPATATPLDLNNANHWAFTVGRA